jgi:hypothetical protein
MTTKLAAALRLAAAVAAACPCEAGAFGPIGHRIAGRLAEPHLCAAAHEEILRLGAGESLAEIGLWADRIRSDPDWRHTAPWHYVNIDDGASEAAIRAYRHAPEGDVLWAVERFETALADRARPAPERTDALRLLVHFVVDVHQPLHVGRAADRGGNEIAVRLGSTETNLHRFWDSDVLELRGLSAERYARRLAPRLRGAAAGTEDVAAWAAESMALRGLVYDFAPARSGAVVLRPEYLETARSVTEDRLVAAARRLAATLNRALCE